MNDQNACMACSCPCEMHKEHNHPTQQEEHSMTCSKCGLKANSKGEIEEHGKFHQRAFLSIE